MDRKNFLTAVKITSPVFFGYVSIGIPFGLMVVNAGYPWYLAPIMSIFVFTGTGQYIAIAMFAAGARLPSIMLIQALVGVRHIFYGLSFITKFKNTGKWKPYLIFALSDETYAVLCSAQIPQGAKAGEFYGTVAALDQSYWILGAFIGAVAGSLIKFSFEGVDFALTTLFAVILTEQIISSKDIIPPAIGIAAAVVAIVLTRSGIIPNENMLLVALAIALAALIFAKRKSLKAAASAEQQASANEKGGAGGSE